MKSHNRGNFESYKDIDTQKRRKIRGKSRVCKDLSRHSSL